MFFAQAQPEPELIEQIIEFVTKYAAEYGLKILGAIAILIVGRIVAGIAQSIVKKVMGRHKVEPAVVSFTSSLTYIGLLAAVVIGALGTLGVQTTSFVAVIGAAGLAIGLALQGSLSNFAAGFLIVIFRPFKVNDFIEAAGVAGVVKHIEIFTTELLTPDNKLVIIPNSALTAGNIINYTAAGQRRVDLVIGIAYDADIKKAREVVLKLLKEEDKVLSDPAPFVGVAELADSSVNLAVRPWCKVEDYWGVFFETQELVKLAFDEAGIGIPFPQRDVHIIASDKE